MPHRDWLFRVYVAGETPLGARTVANLRALVDDHLPDRSTIEVIDLREDPRMAVTHRILAVPTVVRVRPEPSVRIIGDLSDAAEAHRALDLPARIV